MRTQPVILTASYIEASESIAAVPSFGSYSGKLYGNIAIQLSFVHGQPSPPSTEPVHWRAARPGYTKCTHVSAAPPITSNIDIHTPTRHRRQEQ
jgi:hypothetical protein